MDRREREFETDALGDSAVSAYFNERTPSGDVETLEFFAKRVGDLSKVREDVVTWADYLDLDDHVTFGGKA